MTKPRFRCRFRLFRRTHRGSLHAGHRDCLWNIHILRSAGPVFIPGNRPDTVWKLRRVPARRDCGRVPRYNRGLSPLLVPVMATIAATMKADAQVLFCNHGVRADHQRRGRGNVLSYGRSVPARQPAAFHPVSGGRRICGRDRGGRLSGGLVPDGGKSGLAGDGVARDDCAVDMAPGRRLWGNPVWRHQALGKSLDPTGKHSARDRRVPSCSFRPRHFRRRGKGGGAASCQHSEGEPVAVLCRPTSRTWTGPRSPDRYRT